VSFEDEMRDALASFVVEGRELITQMEADLLGLELGEDGVQPSHETVNSVFRAAHTIKGSAGLFGLDHIVRFTHVVESVLDRLRNDEISVSTELVGSLLPCADHLSRLINAIEDGRLDENPDDVEVAASLLADLRPYLEDAPAPAGAGVTGGTAAGTEAPAGAGTAGDPADGTVAEGAPRALFLSLRFGDDCLRNGMDPLAFVRYLSTLGDVVRVVTLTDLLPEAASFDPEACYLAFAAVLHTDVPIEQVVDVFEFVRESSVITVLGPEHSVADHAALVRDSGVLGPRLRDLLVDTGAVDGASLDAVLEGRALPASAGPVSAVPAPRSGEPSTAGGSAPERRGTERRVVERRAADGGEVRGGALKESRSIRIDAGRLDRLIDAVGELVIAGASAELGASQARDEALLSALGEVMRLVEEVRDSALQLRMVPIGTTFSRFQRVVRDVSAALGKDIGLVISGGDTEVDKALVEQIGDPLMHLVRNSMDHGIESAEVRAERGKPARGTLRLNAYHDSGSIVIEVSDDGGGIDTERVLAKAIDRGIIEPGASLTDNEIAQLVFEPGFSTADAVSDLSGRGVGMDVVMRNVTSLRGAIDIDNRPGDGCTMRIRLPLTLAIIDGFMVVVGGATFVIPLDWVVECVELPTDSDARDCMALRGEVLPFIRLRHLFKIRGERPRRENVVVVEYAGMKIGLVVDTLMGEFQTVIKPLGKLFEHVQSIGGSTILGNGEVALIVDVPLLVRQFTDRTPATHALGTPSP
jgi:two-component system chemotaxis sensor kinase CheA